MTDRPSVAPWSTLLSEAAEQVEAGHAARAQELLRPVFEQGSAAERAEARLLLANLQLRLQGSFEAALDNAQRAALDYAQLGDTRGECRALHAQAIAATRLGFYEMALDGALMAVRLADSLPPCPEAVMAYHALGIAMYLGRCFSEASAAYQHGLQLAAQCQPPLPPYELQVDLANTESVRYVVERAQGGRRAGLEPLSRQLQICDALLSPCAAPPGLTPGSAANTRFIHLISSALLAYWKGEPQQAEQPLHALEQALVNGQRPWLRTALAWLRAEAALAAGLLARAELEARDAQRHARHHHHEALFDIASQVLTHVLERQGRLGDALAVLRQLAERQHRHRAGSLHSRIDIIDRRMALRRRAPDPQQQLKDTQFYQRLAMEDALTGLANRRRFEQQLAEWLDSPLPDQLPNQLHLAMVDLDRFKAINDQHSHATGDAVLRRLAGLLEEGIREGDLAARWAGDEFVLLLRGLDDEQATQVAQRLRERVAQTDWNDLAPGLQVSLSIGLSQALPDDSVSSLLARADAQMYQHKRRR
jgi:diguanylate cyclase (GGDEF)-like protein